MPIAGQTFPRKQAKKVKDLLNRDPTLTKAGEKNEEGASLDWRGEEGLGWDNRVSCHSPSEVETQIYFSEFLPVYRIQARGRN